MANKKILVVDDDPDIRYGMQIRLRANNYDTVFAGDVPSCMAEALNSHPDLVLLDLGLPGDDGYTVLEGLHATASLKTIPIIVISARDVHTNQARAVKAGAKAFIQKPMDDTELLAVIRKTLEEAPARLEPAGSIWN